MKANIGLDGNGMSPLSSGLILAPVISSSTVPLISLARAREMKSRPPALSLSDAYNPSPTPQLSSYVMNSDGGGTDSTNPPIEPKSPPLPTPPLANGVPGGFELEIEKALGKVGNGEVKTPEVNKDQPLLELSIPIGLN
jgi:hypothetical protein